MPRPADRHDPRRPTVPEPRPAAPLVPELAPPSLTELLDRLARHETDLAAMRRRLRNGFAGGKR
jgi:hypothetical protein